MRITICVLLLSCACSEEPTPAQSAALAGTCDAFAVLSEQPDLTNVQLDDASVYVSYVSFTDAWRFTIARVPKTGGPLEPLVTGDGYRFRYLVAEGYLFYAIPETIVGPWDLVRIPLDGTGPPETVFVASAFTDLTYAAGQLYFRVDSYVVRVELDGSGLDYLGSFDNIRFMIPAADALYYLRAVATLPNGTLRSLVAFDYATRQRRTVATISPTASDRFAHNSSALYWTEWDPAVAKHHLRTVANAGGVPTSLADSVDDGMYDPVASDAVVVWQEYLGGGNAEAIYALPAGGGDRREIVPGRCIVAEWGDSIAIDATYIFTAGQRDDPPPMPTLRRGDL